MDYLEQFVLGLLLLGIIFIGTYISPITLTGRIKQRFSSRFDCR